MAKASPCPFRFQMATEGGWDVGCFAACLITAALAALGVSLAVALLLALPGIAAAALQLQKIIRYSRGVRFRKISIIGVGLLGHVH